MNAKKALLILLAILIAGFLLLQAVPYGRAHDNPPVVREPDWSSAETKALAQRACYDCHSNETVWPWYSNIAPVSWLTQHDVDEGRQYLNFSEWGGGREGEEGEELGEVIYEGEMPPSYYLLSHPEARLSETEKQALATGLTTMAGGAETGETRSAPETGEHESGEREEAGEGEGD